MESGEKKFDADTLEKALAAVEKAELVEEKDTPRAVIMAMYPRLQEVMAAKQMSVRQLYQALKAQMDLPISEKTFSTYLQAAKKALEGEKSRRGRKKAKGADLPRNVSPDAGHATAGQDAKGEDEPEAGLGQMEEPEDDATDRDVTPENQPGQMKEPPAGANGSVEPADAKAAFEAHEAELDDDMEALAAKLGKKE